MRTGAGGLLWMLHIQLYPVGCAAFHREAQAFMAVFGLQSGDGIVQKIVNAAFANGSTGEFAPRCG